MGISRGTIQRLLYPGRRKVIDALMHGKALAIQESTYVVVRPPAQGVTAAKLACDVLILTLKRNVGCKTQRYVQTDVRDEPRRYTDSLAETRPTAYFFSTTTQSITMSQSKSSIVATMRGCRTR